MRSRAPSTTTACHDTHLTQQPINRGCADGEHEVSVGRTEIQSPMAFECRQQYRDHHLQTLPAHTIGSFPQRNQRDVGHSRRVHVRAFRHEKQESWFVQRGITITGMPSRMLRNPIRLSSSGQRPYTQLFYFAIFRPAASSLLAQVVSPRPGKGQHERVKVSAGVVLRELYRRAEPTHSRIVGELARLLPFSGGVTVTSIVLIVMLPVMLMVAALIRIVMGGPVIFAQDRIGLGGRVFTCYKFRTMVAGLLAALQFGYIAGLRVVHRDADAGSPRHRLGRRRAARGGVPIGDCPDQCGGGPQLRQSYRQVRGSHQP